MERFESRHSRNDPTRDEAFCDLGVSAVMR
ncbi:MAG: hypothetical protein RLZZ117_2893 [Cyanobacteriota bacterium]|jgi:hypothetical protein